MDMTISQALRRISKLKGEYKESLDRAASGVTFEAKHKPAYAFGATLEQANVKRSELIRLEAALRVTNARTTFDYRGRSVTLTEATILLQESKARIAWLQKLAVQPHADITIDTLDYDDEGKRVKTSRACHCDLPEVERAGCVTKEQADFDELNDIVETLNHRTSLAQAK